MLRPALPIPIALAIAALFAAPATASGGTSVSINKWIVTTSDGKSHKLDPGDTLRSCKSKFPYLLKAKGEVRGAHKGAAFKQRWSRNGKTYATLPDTWSQAGRFKHSFVLGSEGGLPDAVWQLKVIEGGSTIGHSKITLKTKKGC